MATLQHSIVVSVDTIDLLILDAEMSTCDHDVSMDEDCYSCQLSFARHFDWDKWNHRG